MAYNPKYKEKVYEYAKNHFKRVPLDVGIDFYNDELKPAADRAGMKVNAFIKLAISEKIERDRLQDRETDRADDPLPDDPDEELPPFDL